MQIVSKHTNFVHQETLVQDKIKSQQAMPYQSEKKGDKNVNREVKLESSWDAGTCEMASAMGSSVAAPQRKKMRGCHMIQLFPPGNMPSTSETRVLTKLTHRCS